MRLSPKYLEQIGILSQVESKWQYSFLWIMDPENECTFRLDSFFVAVLPFDWRSVNILCNSSYGALFWICDENSVDNTLIL